jgi:hypothetical protein
VGDIREDVRTASTVRRRRKEAEALSRRKGPRRSLRLHSPDGADTIIVLSCPSKQFQLVLGIHGCPLLSNPSIRTFVQYVKFLIYSTAER